MGQPHNIRKRYEYDTYFDDANETDEGRDCLGGEITGEKSPKESKTFATPRGEGTLPLGLWFCALEDAPEGIKLEGEEEVEKRAGERYEESDRSSGTVIAKVLAKVLEKAPAREREDRPGWSRHLLPTGNGADS